MSIPPSIQTPAVDMQRRLTPFWFNLIMQLLNPTKGFTGTITTTKLTGGGTNGSMTFEDGRLISQVAAT